ncbi:TRM11 family SAM-dependent methyltransferase [Glycomyces paridis]|uniref:SAM-dependent methyltransferase n=1 Tax=Glycomyces paridis TaxID=2126555 RepID=A0A4S8PIH9_9ACTN|nr:SAM-dependent methyltransferase [Glycomyces paridis]THV29505.1 SAM-dependent methyltransferase [Glycomyces paridis]
MRRYAMLVSPSANRVYARTAARMMRHEFGVFRERLLEGAVEDVEEVEFGGVPYLVFGAESLSGRDLRVLANLSSLFALFEVHGSMLEPVAVERLDRYDDDLVSILKYVGKTNEQFTKLLVNVTAAAALTADRFLGDRPRLLDPLAGRGTTLNQAAMYGWDGYGVEIDGTDFDAYAVFLERWLKGKFIKHKVTKSRVKREGRSVGRRMLAEFAATKEAFRAGDVQTVELVGADTTRSGEVYRKNSFDLIVTDAPYGVQHASVNSERALSRSPRALLEAAIPEWAALLRDGGAMGLSWNTQVLPREDLASILENAGLAVLDSEPFLGFEHRVGQAIDRDLIVAVKPRAAR